MNSEETPELRSIWDEAKAHIERGDYDKAVETYRYILIRYADNVTAVEHATVRLGDIYVTTRHLDLADKHLNKWSQLEGLEVYAILRGEYCERESGGYFDQTAG